MSSLEQAGKWSGRESPSSEDVADEGNSNHFAHGATGSESNELEDRCPQC